MTATTRAALFLACVASPAIARADDKTDADALFNQGMEDLGTRHIAKACAEFTASLAKSPNIVTQGALADCDTQVGKLASAWKLWRELATTATGPDLQAEAAKNAQALEPRLPKVVFRVAVAVPGLAVTINGEAVDPQVVAGGSPLVVDPGPLAVSASAPHVVTWTRTYQIAEATSVQVDVPDMTPIKVIPHWETKQWAGAITAGVGAAAILAGAAFGFEARSNWNDVEKDCGGTVSTCRINSDNTPLALRRVDAARSDGTRADVLLAVGVVAVATGAFVFTRKRRSEPQVAVMQLAPAIAPTFVGVSMSGVLP